MKQIESFTVNHLELLPGIYVSRKDKFNEITITTISDSSADVGLIAGLAEKFIRANCPVYLIEVG